MSTVRQYYCDVEKFFNSTLESHDSIQINLNDSYIPKQINIDQNLYFALSKCTKLLELSISLQKREIGTEGCQKLGSALLNCTNLQDLSLDLFHTLIGGQGLSDICFGIMNCSKLQRLSLQLKYNQIEAYGIQNLSTTLCCFKDLEYLYLDLSDNLFGAQICSELVTSLAKCAQLSQLTLLLQWNKLGAQGVSNLIVSLQNYSNLQNLKLDLSWNRIFNESFESLYCLNLQKLELSFIDNALGDKSIPAIASKFKNCKHLKNLRLDISNNEFDEQDAKNLAFELQNCQKLEILSVIFIKKIKFGLQLCAQLSKLTNLKYQYYYLGNRYFSYKSHHQPRRSISISKLSIDFYFNDMIEEYDLELCSLLTKYLPLNLKLGFSYTQLGNTNLGSTLVECSNIQKLSLDLSDSRISKLVISNFGSAFINLKNLRKLKLSVFEYIMFEYDIHEAGVLELSYALKKCNRLQILKLAFSKKISGQSKQKLEQNISKIMRLVKKWISYR